MACFKTIFPASCEYDTVPGDVQLATKTLLSCVVPLDLTLSTSLSTGATYQPRKTYPIRIFVRWHGDGQGPNFLLLKPQESLIDPYLRARRRLASCTSTAILNRQYSHPGSNTGNPTLPQEY